MQNIRKIQSRDVQSLADTFFHQNYDYFESMYLEHLQEQRLCFVAVEKDDDGERHYYGYVSLLWESGYTQFWRRNIPEITDLYVLASQRRQGIGTALITACEKAVGGKGQNKVGISVIQDKKHKFVQSLYQASGYTDDGFGVTDSQLHLVKELA